MRVAVSCRRSVIRQGYGIYGGAKAGRASRARQAADGLVQVQDDLVRDDTHDHALLAWPVPERLAGVLEREFVDQLGRQDRR